MLRINSQRAVIIVSFLIFVNPSLSQADSGKTEAVNRQLDQIEQEFPPIQQDAQKVFSNIQPDAQKEFSSVHPDAKKEFFETHPDSPSPAGMFKKILNPELSLTPSPKSPSNIATRVHSFDLGSEIFFYRYQEPAPVGIKIQGPMYGYYANYAYRPADPGFFNNFLTNVYFLQARYAISRSLEYSGDGIYKNKHDEADEFRGLIGKDYNLGTDSIVTPYFGFGYRYLIDHGNGLHNSEGSDYDRKSHYYYLPLGVNVAINLPKNWEIDPNVEYDILLSGWQKSYLSDTNQFTGENGWDVVNHQDHGYGVRGSLKFIKKGRLVDFYVEPYIRFWHIAQSKPEPGLFDGSDQLIVEPDNNTTEVGSEFGVQF